MVRAVLKSYRKNILREMKDNLSRMVSLFGIVALGVMMLTGLMSFAPSMRIAGQKYYVQQNVFDLRVLSTLGLSEEDIAAIAAVDGVEAVQPVKYQDVEAQWQGQSETAVVRLQQLPADPGADTAENMNRLVLLSGRMPEAPDECVVHVMGYGDPVEPGTVLTMPEDTEHVSRKQFTVVGTVQDPQHFSTDKESSTAGDGQLDDIVFLPEGSLTTDYYTACYLKVKNAGLYDNYSDAYQAAVDDTAARVKAISGAQCTARRAELIEDASAELADARAEYNDKKAEADRQFAEAEQQLADAQAQLDSAKAQLDAGEAELAANKKALPDTMQGGADELVSGEEQLLEFEDQLQQIEMLVNLKKVADPLLGYAETALHNAQKALDEAEPADEEYTDLRDALQKAQDAYDNISGQLNGYQAQLDEGKHQMYAQGLISSPSLSNEQLVTEAKAALRQMKVKLLQGQLQLTTGTATAYTQFDAARTRLDEGWQQYNDGVQQLADSRAEYESRKAEAEQQLADGLAQLNDAEEQVSQIKSGEWYVLDRGSTMSFVTFEQYADRMDAIARVFPVFFFLVAALVATTTMTRMVDENRLQLGTLKALGYSNAKIAGKYLFYALSASVLGSIVGMVIGFVVFPLIIWYAYQMIFSMSTFTLHFYPGMAAASVAISAAVIGFATWNACRASLKEKTAAGYSESSGLLQRKDRRQVSVLCPQRQRAGQHRGHGHRFCGVPAHHLVCLPDDLQHVHLYAALLPRHGGSQRSHQRGRHRFCYMERLPCQPEGKDCSFAAAPGPGGRQAHLFGVHYPAVAAHELLPKDHSPQPVPLQKALLHDSAGRGRLHGAAADRFWHSGFHPAHRGQAVRAADPQRSHYLAQR